MDSGTGSPGPTPGADHAIAEVLRVEESDRTRGFASSVMGLSALVALAIPWLGGDRGAVPFAVAGLATTFLTAAWLRYRTREGGRYDDRVFRIGAWAIATGVLGPEYYIGFCSPVAVVLSLGIYYLGQARDLRTGVATSLWTTAGWVAGCLAVATGTIPDHGLFRMPVGQPRLLAFMTVAVSCCLLVTLGLALLARAGVARAIQRSNEAVLLAQKQAAQLAEARNQLARAMRLAVGKAGHHTGQLAGDARLGVLIGLGAMGEVYEGIDERSGQPVAVKLLHDSTRRESSLLERFLREAEICKQLDHPNLARLHDAGTLQSGDPFLTMERLVGEDLGAILRERGRLPLSQVVEMCEGVAAGLEHAHQRDVIHRDLKPHNIFRVKGLRDAARWKVLDFGISKRIDDGNTLTREGVVGTPAYMSPEQARGKTLDRRSDVFALAAVAYRALTGQPAFPGTDTPRIMFDVTYRQPNQPSTLARGLPGDVDLALALGLAKDPARRFDSAPGFARALRAAADRKLGGALRAQARDLLANQPWGSTPGGAELPARDGASRPPKR